MSDVEQLIADCSYWADGRCKPSGAGDTMQYAAVELRKQCSAIAALTARVAELEKTIRPLADIPLKEFGWGERRPDQPITGWNRHTLYVRDVLAARLASADSTAYDTYTRKLDEVQRRAEERPPADGGSQS